MCNHRFERSLLRTIRPGGVFNDAAYPRAAAMAPGPFTARRRARCLAAAVLAAIGMAWRARRRARGRMDGRVAGRCADGAGRARGGALELTVSGPGRPCCRLRSAAATRARRRTRSRRLPTPAGKRRRHELVARRLRIALPHGRGVELLVADDGVALRTTGAGREVAAWRAPAGARAWLQTYRRDYEGPYVPVALRAAEAGDYGFPALVRSGGAWALLTESGLRRQAAARLTIGRGRPGVLRVALPPGAAEPRTTPWRVAVVGDLPTVVGSDLPLSLGRPSQIRDTSWIKPGRVAWSWWSDRDSPGDLSRQRAFVREAAAHRWEYVLLDDGWDPAEVPGSPHMPPEGCARDGVDRVVEAARRPPPRPALRPVGGVGRRGRQGRLPALGLRRADGGLRRHRARRGPRPADRRLPRLHRAARHPAHVAERADDGGGRGRRARDPRPGRKAMDPRQDVDLVFTRNVIGSMDYTPVTFSARHRGSTDAHRLALAVAYESGLQHFADSPESYAKHPQAAQVLTDIPTAWDDTRLLAGAPDRESIVARRAGATWWIGSVSATGPHEQTVSLGFLTPGVTYRLHLVRDDGHGGLATEDRTLTSTDRLSVAVERNGGYTAEFTPSG